MKKEILINLKESLSQIISPNKQKIISTLTAVPLIAASSMQGACAGGCPYGLVNDPFPGQCSRFTDLNGDGICDLSQSITPTTDPTTSSSSDPSTSIQEVDTSNGQGHSASNVNLDTSNTSTIPDQGTGGLDSSIPLEGTNYHILPITLLIIGGYLFTYYLFKKGILKPQKHKRIWNLLLVGGYLGTGVTGILLTFMINLGISTIYNPGITYWHAELSILMVVGTLVHLHLYKKPFKNMFKVLFGFNFNSKKKNNRKPVSI